MSEEVALLPKPNPRYGVRPDGWTGSADARLAAEDGHLRIHSTGGDPWIRTDELPETRPAAITIRMRSETAGGGRVYFSTARKRGFRDHYVEFDPEHNNRWHEHRVELPVRQPLRALRIDPATAEGTIRIDRIELLDPDDGTLKRWDF